MTDLLLDAIFTNAQLDDAAPDGISIRTKLRRPLVSGYVNGTRFFANNPPPEAANEYWMRSGVAGFAQDAPTHYFLPERYTDAFNNATRLEFDNRYDLFIRSSRDALGNDSNRRGPSTIGCWRRPSCAIRAATTRRSRSTCSACRWRRLSWARQRTESGDNVAALLTDLPAGAVSGIPDVCCTTRPVPAGWLGARDRALRLRLRRGRRRQRRDDVSPSPSQRVRHLARTSCAAWRRDANPGRPGVLRRPGRRAGEEVAGGAGPGQHADESAAALDCERQDGAEQQGQAGQAVRAVLQRRCNTASIRWRRPPMSA